MFLCHFPSPGAAVKPPQKPGRYPAPCPEEPGLSSPAEFPPPRRSPGPAQPLQVQSSIRPQGGQGSHSGASIRDVIRRRDFTPCSPETTIPPAFGQGDANPYVQTGLAACHSPVGRRPAYPGKSIRPQLLQSTTCRPLRTRCNCWEGNDIRHAWQRPRITLETARPPLLRRKPS